MSQRRIQEQTLHDLPPEVFARLLELACDLSLPATRSRDRALLTLLYHGRLSAAELCGMRLSELTLKDGLPQFRARPLTKEAQSALHHWLKRRKLLARHVEVADSDTLWVDGRGRALTEEDVAALLGLEGRGVG